MDLRYENQGAAVFLVCELSADEQIDELSMGMLKNNQLSNILPVAFVQMDEKRFLRWNISSKVDMASYLGGKINKINLLNIFSSICEAFAVTEDYLMDNGQFLLDRQYMFCNVSTGITSLVYLPVIRKTEPVDLIMLIKSILVSVNFQEGDDTSYVAILMNHLNQQNKMTAVELRKLIEDLKRPTDKNRMPNITKGPNDKKDYSGKPGEFSYTGPENLNKNPQYNNGPVQRREAQVDYPQFYVETPPQNPFQNSSMPVKQNNQPWQSSPNTTQQGNMAAGSQPNMAQNQASELKEEPEKKGIFSFVKKKNAQKNENKGGGKAQNSKEPKNTYMGMKIPGKDNGNGEVQTKYVPGKGQVQFNSINVPQNGLNQVQYQNQAAMFNQPPQQPPVNMQPAQQPPVNMQPPVYNRPEMFNPQNQPLQQNNYQNPFAGPQGSNPFVNGDETTVLKPFVSDGDSTMKQNARFVNGQAVYIPTATLRRMKNNQVMEIHKDIFHVGREENYVDFCVPDNVAVSKSHADIICRDRKYYLKDINSLNHTYLNGEMLTSNTEYELRSGDSILLANEEFEFRVR